MYRLFPSSPAPVSNTTAVASSITTRFAPIRRHNIPAELRPPSNRPSRKLENLKCRIGVTENKIPASSAKQPRTCRSRAPDRLGDRDLHDRRG